MSTNPAITNSKPTLQSAWVTLLSEFNWEWFITHTFREECHPERADKLWRLWCSKINRDLYGPTWAKKMKKGTVPGIYWTRAIEYQKRGVIHFHGLMSGVEALNQFTWMENWLNLDGYGTSEGLTGISRIHTINTQNDYTPIINYISKYVTKQGEIDLSPNMPGYSQHIRQRIQLVKN